MAPNFSNELECDQLWNITLGDFYSKRSTKEEIENAKDIKCVLVGDGAVGKTSLVISYTTNGYPNEYVPTAFDDYSVKVDVDQHPVRFQICDTAGQDDFDQLRPLCYPGSDVILICFSVVRPTSLCNVKEKWIPEMKKHLPKVPVILIGTQTDLRSNLDVLVDLARYNARPVTEQEGQKFAKECGACGYMECSALTQKNLKDVFDCAVLGALDCHSRKDKKRSRSWRRKAAQDFSHHRTLTQGHAPVKNTNSKWRKFLCFS